MTEPKLASQIDENGDTEKVDTNVYPYKIVCRDVRCTQIRYVRAQDRTQVKFCKVHAREARLASRARRARDNRAKKAQ